MNAPKAFVIGWPVAHSRSPLIHRFWLERHGIEGDYLREAVEPDALDHFLSSFRARGFVGGNVTLPHKEAAARACRTLTDVAGRLGAANTLWIEDGRLRGDNTDVYGFSTNLDAGAPGWRGGGVAIVIGAGGASRAVLQALIEAQFRSVVVLNRTPARAEALAARFGPPVEAAGLDALDRRLPAADLIVNASSAGLDGNPGVDLDWSAARPDAVATDLVYAPPLTPFLQGALNRGLKVVDGLGMLMHQAVPGFERWFGTRPEVDGALRNLLVADLER